MSSSTFIEYLHIRSCLLATSTLLFFSCGEDAQIRSYEIPSEYNGPVVTWELPDEWGENPDISGPMAGSFHVKTELGPMGRIGVMPFRESVSSVDVANMFAMELGQARMNEDDLTKISEIRKIEGRDFEWISLNDQGQEGSTRKILLALFRNEGETWLFPFIAEQKLVLKESENFIQFLNSCTLRSAKDKPIIARSPPSENRINKPSPPRPTRDNPWTWEIPPTWQDGKASSMRIASLKVADKNGSKLDISVTTFPGDVGGLLANVNRWVGQIELSPVSQSSLEKYCTPFTIAGNSGHFIEAYGEKEAVLAGALFLEKESWFFKLLGNKSLAEKEKENFIMFLHSISPKSGSEKK